MTRPPFRTLHALLSALLVSGGLLACASRGAPEPPGRVILFSWDGAADWVLREVLARADLPHLERLVAEGTLADGMVSSFPTKTAAGHAMLWTGRYGHQNGITANSILREPAAAHSRLETRSGYLADGLRAEPLWTMTARAGLPTYAFHATQSYPFEAATTWLEPASLANLHVLYGYTRTSSRGRIADGTTHPPERPAGWSAPEAAQPGALQISLPLGDDAWWGLLFDDPSNPQVGLDTLGLAASRDNATFDLRIEAGLAAGPSPPVVVRNGDAALPVTLRLFDLAPDGSDYLLYLSSARELVASTPTFPGATDLSTQPFAGNGAGRFYRQGTFGPTLPEGGDGTAERRFLKTLEDLADQLRLQARPMFDRADYRLAILYSPILDDATHTWAGYLDPRMPGHDPQLAEALWPSLVAAWELHEEMLAEVLEAADRDGAHILLVSDHGMAGTNRRVHLNVALERAGLLGRTADGRIDLARTRALYPPLADAGIAVNTTDRAGGIVAPEERGAVLDAVREALAAVTDPRTGEPVVTGFFEATTDGPLQPGGSTTGDLFLDFAPGYYPSDRLTSGETITETSPEGNHIFLPTREEMLSVCIARGPRLPRGTDWPTVRSIDIAPTVLDLLGLPVPEDLPGRSLLAGTNAESPTP